MNQGKLYQSVILLITLIVLLMTVTISAADSPIDKGSVILGGTVSYQTGLGDYSGSSLLSVHPDIGVFVSKGLILGSSLVFDQTFGQYRDVTSFGIGPMIGYYHDLNPSRPEAKGATYNYIKFSINYISRKYENSGKLENTYFIIGTGINYMISNSMALDAGVIIQGDRIAGEFKFQQLMIGAGISAFLY